MGWQATLVAALVLAALVGLVVVDRDRIGASIAALAHLHRGWVLAGIGAEGLAVLAGGLGGRRLLRAGQSRIKLRSVVAVGSAGAALGASVPVVGPQVAAAYAFRQYGRRGVELPVRWWALIVSWILNNGAFAVVLLVGSALAHNLAASSAGVASAAYFLILPAGLLGALRSGTVRQALHRLVARSTGWSRRRFGRPRGDVVARLDQTLARMALLRLPLRQFGEVFLAYLCTYLGDIACLVFALRAVGAPIPWRGLVLVYSAGIGAESLGLTPGGVGLVEAAMSAALVAAGLHAGLALTVVLVYRLMSFWLLVAAGWLVMAWLSWRPGRPIEPAPSHDPAVGQPAPPGL